MRLVDTSAWIEWLVAPRAGETLGRMMPRREDWVVPTIVQLELAKWAARELGEDKVDQVLAFSSACVVVPLDTKLALTAAEMCRRHKLATADAVVYATAVEHGSDVLTCDAHLEGLPGVVSCRKRILERRPRPPQPRDALTCPQNVSGVASMSR